MRVLELSNKRQEFPTQFPTQGGGVIMYTLLFHLEVLQTFVQGGSKACDSTCGASAFCSLNTGATFSVLVVRCDEENTVVVLSSPRSSLPLRFLFVNVK